MGVGAGIRVTGLMGGLRQHFRGVRCCSRDWWRRFDRRILRSSIGVGIDGGLWVMGFWSTSWMRVMIWLGMLRNDVRELGISGPAPKV